ncbi:MAG: F0F1 ATP synthase subunit A [Planctomycetota bacterium]
MEEAQEHAAEDTHGEEQGEPFNAMHHILDQVLVGVDKGTGQIVWRPYDKHGHSIASYAPSSIGPVKLEFTKHMCGVTVVAALVFALSMLVAKRVLKSLHSNQAPQGGLANAIEAIVVFVRDEMVAPIGGHHLGHYTPLFITYFLFILACNLLGMIPNFGTVTGNAGVTLALGGSVYALIWILGMYNQGPVKYVVHLVPPGTPWWMWLLMFALELLSPAIKCGVLCVRLFANMIAGHLIVGTVLGLGAFGGGLTAGLAGMLLVIGLPLALGISALEILVCFIQAYVFTLLAVIFIGAAVHPEH